MTVESSEAEAGAVSVDSMSSVVGAVGLSMTRSVQRPRPARTTVLRSGGFRGESDPNTSGGIMKTSAAILWETNAPWSVEEIELDAPQAGEVLVEMKASGMCHSDEHLVTGDLPFALPIIGGHEGAGIVRQVGEGVSWLAPGDHVVFGFIPSCGRCRSCSTGHQNLCDLGALMGGGRQITDGGSRHHARGQDLGLMCLLGTFEIGRAHV